MLPCSCEGLGDIPQPLNTSSKDEIRDCQLLIGQNQKSMTSLRMNQLFQWEHHAQPFRPELLKVSWFVGYFHSNIRTLDKISSLEIF